MTKKVWWAYSLIVLFATSGCNKSVQAPDVPQSNVVFADGRKWANDPYVVNSASIDGSWLIVEVSFSGGCRRHDFILVLSTTFEKSDPVELSAVLSHNAKEDPCEAYPTETHSFDLSLVKTLYQETYGQSQGVVALQIEKVSENTLVYEFVE